MIFSPRWFIAIMGTGAVANVLQLISGRQEGFVHASAVALLSLAVAMYPIVLVLISSRLFIDSKMVFKELNHSSLVQFYSAIFIAAAVCATGLVKIPQVIFSPESTLVLAKSFWIIALVSAIPLIIFTPWRIITLNHGEPKRLLGFWFLPPVGLFVLVFSGNFLAQKISSYDWQNFIFMTNTTFLGIAIVWSSIMFTLFLFRALAYPFPRGDIVPSFTIGLAPIGVSIIALLSYIPVIAKLNKLTFVSAEMAAAIIKFIAVMLWGFGFWWMIVVFLVLIHAYFKSGIPVTLGYWAFIFPPAAYSLASLSLGEATELFFIKYVGVLLGYAISVLWILVTILTIRGILNKKIFILPPSFADLLQDEIKNN